MEEQAQRKYGLYTPTSEGDDDFPSIPGMIARYSALSLTNEQMAENPVWKDLTGNGYDLQMKNFAWSGMSGVDGYEYNFLSSDWVVGKVQLSEALSYKITIVDKKNSVQLFKYIRNESENTIKITLKVTGIEINGCTFRVYDNASMSHAQDYKKDGIYQINYTATEGSDRIYFYVYGGNMGQLDNPITIEQLPLYPGALVFDGVDDYGVCDNFPILTKEKGYTVVALRQWISMGEGISGLVSNVKNWFNDGAFVLEYNSNNATNKFVNRPVSFGNVNIEMDLPNNFTYQTSKSYKGVPITTGSFKGTNSLFVGKLNNIIGNCSNVAIWELVFLDHDATEEELTKIKDYFVKTYPWLFPDQAWTVTGKTNEDEDRATISNITGNGNDLVLSNFAFSGNSGYGSYVCNFNDTSTWIYYSYNGTIEITSSTIHVTEAKTARPFLEKNASSGGYNKVKIKVTGIKDGEILKFMSDEDRDNTINIEKDGIYSLPGSDKLYYGFRLSNSTNTYPFNCDITIEQIPEYEGYLVADGVDDKVESSPFTLNKDWTIVGNWTMLSNIPSNCGIIKVSSVFLYNSLDGVTIYFAGGPIKIQSKSINAFCSDGRVYLNDWTEILKPDAQIASGGIKSGLNIASYSANFTKMAFKNLAIYDGKNLSKDDCIKAYNYLQTLKAK